MNSKLLAFLLILTVYLAVNITEAAEDVPPLVSTCAACHGKKGVSQNDLWPNLAGQKKGYLIKQLKDYLTGKRKDDLMTPVSKMLTDEQIEQLANYYSQLECP